MKKYQIVSLAFISLLFSCNSKDSNVSDALTPSDTNLDKGSEVGDSEKEATNKIIARKSDWSIMTMPDKKKAIGYRRMFTADEMERIKMGFIPQQMEDKWFVYYENKHLYLHRSWTGLLVYWFRFEEGTEGGSVVEAWVNDDEDLSKRYLIRRNEESKIGDQIIDFLLKRDEINDYYSYMEGGRVEQDEPRSKQ